MLATRLGAAAVDAFAAGEHGVLVGVSGNEVVHTPLQEVVKGTKILDQSLLALAQVLAQ
jgi:6-phosphofructokinase 1